MYIIFLLFYYTIIFAIIILYMYICIGNFILDNTIIESLDMDEKTKIELLMKEFSLNSAQFAEEVGIKIATLSHILNDRNKPSLDVLKKILSRYKQVNPEWLILDAGSMFRQILNSQEPTLFDELDLTSNKSASKHIVEPQNIHTEVESKENISRISDNNDVDSLKTTTDVKTIIEKVYVPQIEYRTKGIARIIIYYDDNTYEEFDPRKQKPE